MSNSKLFDYLAGKTEGPLAAAEAALEHTAGYLGVELEENAKLRTEIERLRAALEPVARFADEARYVRWRGLIPGSSITVEEAERAAKILLSSD